MPKKNKRAVNFRWKKPAEMNLQQLIDTFTGREVTAGKVKGRVHHISNDHKLVLKIASDKGTTFKEVDPDQVEVG